jgi:hypothetical protein
MVLAISASSAGVGVPCRTPLRLGEVAKAQHLAGGLLVLVERGQSPIHHAQGREIRSGDGQLRAQVPPQRRRYGANRRERATGHAQEAHLQREPALERRLAALHDRLPLGAGEGEKRLELERRELARQPPPAQERRVPVLHVVPSRSRAP